MSSLEDLWDIILQIPIPIGTKVKYVKKKCICAGCTLSSHLGEIGTIVGYEEKGRIFASYPNVNRNIIVYKVQFKTVSYPMLGSELEVVEYR